MNKKNIQEDSYLSDKHKEKMFFDLQGNPIETNEKSLDTKPNLYKPNLQKEDSVSQTLSLEKYLRKSVKIVVLLIVSIVAYNYISNYFIENKESKLVKSVVKTQEKFHSSMEKLEKAKVLLTTINNSLSSPESQVNSEVDIDSDFLDIEKVFSSLDLDEDTFNKILENEITDEELNDILSDYSEDSDFYISENEINQYLDILEESFGDVDFSNINSLDDVINVANDILDKKYDMYDEILDN